MKRIVSISTDYDTVAAIVNGIEYIVIPCYEDGTINAYRLHSGQAAAIQDLRTLPEDAEEVYSERMNNMSNAEAVHTECMRILRQEV